MKNKLLDELQSKTIDWLRFPLAIAVVFIHMNLVVDMQKVDYSCLSGSDIYSITGALISHTLAQIAVPCFFMFSGFLFFYRIKEWNKSVYRSKIKSRLKTLVIPYLLWNLATVIIFAALKVRKMDGSIWIYLNDLCDNGLWRIFWNYSEWGSTNTNIWGLISPNYGPYLLPLWFLRDLIITVFLSPLVYSFIKRTGIFGVALLGVLCYARAGVVVAQYNTNQLITALFYFSLGSYFSINGKNMVVSFRRGQQFWLTAATVSLLLSTYYDGSETRKYILPIYILSGVITAVNITSFFMGRGKLKVYGTLSKASFFIYAAHNISILGLITRIFDKISDSDNAMLLLAKYLAAPFVCAGVILCIYLLMKKFTPKLLNLFTGNR